MKKLMTAMLALTLCASLTLAGIAVKPAAAASSMEDLRNMLRERTATKAPEVKPTPAPTAAPAPEADSASEPDAESEETAETPAQETTSEASPKPAVQKDVSPSGQITVGGKLRGTVTQDAGKSVCVLLVLREEDVFFKVSGFDATITVKSAKDKVLFTLDGEGTCHLTTGKYLIEVEPRNGETGEFILSAGKKAAAGKSGAEAQPAPKTTASSRTTTDLRALLSGKSTAAPKATQNPLSVLTAKTEPTATPAPAERSQAAQRLLDILRGTPEPTEAPAEDELTEGTEAPAEDAELQTEAAQPLVRVYASYPDAEEETPETEVMLYAVVEGVDEPYQLQWQYTPDGGQTVVDVPGATGDEYTFVLNDENVLYQWRVRLILAEEEENAEAEE